MSIGNRGDASQCIGLDERQLKETAMDIGDVRKRGRASIVRQALCLAGERAMVSTARPMRAVILLLLLGIPATSFGAVTDCKGKSVDGRAECTNIELKPAKYTECDDVYASNWPRYYAKCAAWGGCDGQPSLLTRSNLVPKAVEAEMQIHGPSCSGDGTTTGWLKPGETLPSNWCWSGSPTYVNGKEVFNLMPIQTSGVAKDYQGNCTVNWSERVIARVDVEWSCPQGYSKRSNGGQWECYRFEACAPTVGNPICIGNGEKTQIDTDYAGSGATSVSFTRTYSSFGFFEPLDFPNETPSSMGGYWWSNYDRHVYALPSAPYAMAVATRGNAKVKYFSSTGEELAGSDGTVDRVEKLTDSEGVLTGWRYRTGGGDIENYDATGRLQSIEVKGVTAQTLVYSDTGTPPSIAPVPGLLISVSDETGKTLSFTYNSDALLASITDPQGSKVLYGYDSLKNLITVETRGADGTVGVRRYLYENASLPRALTGIKDENNVLVGKYVYDTSGRAISTEGANGVNKYSIAYNTDGSRTVTDPNNTVRSYGTVLANGVTKISSSVEPCANCPGGSSTATTVYDSRGFLQRKTDGNGNVTTYTFDDRGRELSRTEAYGTALAKTTTTDWHPTLRLPTEIDEPGRRTTYTYDGAGNRLTETITDTGLGTSRTTTWTYTADGRFDTVDGPRTDVSDVTHYDYDAQGNLIRITDALGHMTEIPDHDAHGNPLRIVDPNGAETTLTYDSRQRLKTRAIAGATTSFGYDDVGQLVQVTLPDGSALTYTYDAAHRLTDITDSAGNRIHYTLDALGNRTHEETLDPQGMLRRKTHQVFDELGRLQEMRNAADQVTHAYGYDGMGNRTSMTEAGQFTTSYHYDAFNRVDGVTDGANGVTAYEYDALGRLSAVVDPKTLRTDYQYNAFGDLLSQSSPDTGVTTYGYDAAGNRTSQTDARSIAVHYVYDALNRLVSVDYPGAGEDVAYHYDGSNYLAPVAYGVGRLTGIDDASGSTTLLYDPRGNLVEAQRISAGQTHTTQYAYDAADRLTGMTYPSGRQVGYERDTQGRVTRVTTTVDGVTTTVADGIQYLPFGGVASYVLGNGVSVARTFNQDYLLEEQQDQGTQPVRHVRLYHDVRYNIEAIEDVLHTDRSQAFGYDALSRLTSAEGLYGTLGYGYDAIGNRLSETRTPIGGSAATDTYSYAAGSHRLEAITGTSPTSFAYDAAGAVTSKAGLTLSYNAAHRTASASRSGASVQNVYSASGQRTSKASGPEQIVFHYDRGGQLIAETGGGGNLIQREYTWLDDPGSGPGQALPLRIDAVSVRREVVTDNSDSAFSSTGSWTSATVQTGYYGADYLSHGPAGVPAGTVVVDNTDANTSKTGLWIPGLSAQANQGNFESAAGGAANTRFSWHPSVPAAGRYQVYARWYWADLGGLVPAASQAPYAIQHAQGTTTVIANQRINQGRWNLLGTYDFEAGQTQISVIAGSAGGRLIADAVRLVPVEIDGTATIDQVRWRAPDTATYEVYARWPAAAANTPFASFTVQHADGAATVIKNQRTDGGQWNLLGTFSFTDLPTQGIYLSASPNDTVVADAVRFVPALESQIQRQTGYVHVDHLNTPQVITDDNQQVIWEASFEPFGSTTLLQNQIDNPLRFPGQYFDDETELNQNWWRDYDRALGRYLQSDPIGLGGGLSTYAYAGDNPVVNSDPTGLDYWIERSVPGEGGHPYHQSVCVGKRGGPHACISFGVANDDCELPYMGCKGQVYQDMSAQGDVYPGHYRITPKETDDKILQEFSRLNGKLGSYYLIGNSCRTFSQDLFESLVQRYGGTKAIVLPGN